MTVSSSSARPGIETLGARLLAGERAALAQAITLVESRRADHQVLAHELLQSLLPHTGKARRVGITGVPGVGKSTLIESFGNNLTRAGHKVAVLAVDPSSPRSGGSILGDKTRMAKLAADENAFIRPSPTMGTLGGVASRTREAMLLCEAAGFDVIIVETVGAGQSETAVFDMCDVFVVLMLPGAGDELQGIKKGVLELADIICVNKADGDNVKPARIAAAEYLAALHILSPRSSYWQPPVLCVSGLGNTGLEDLWKTIEDHHAALEKSGELEVNRHDQQVRWMWSMLEERLLQSFKTHDGVMAGLSEIEAQVREGTMLPALAAEKLYRLGNV
jgi:LAO/AO transport system kinase